MILSISNENSTGYSVTECQMFPCKEIVNITIRISNRKSHVKVPPDNPRRKKNKKHRV